MDTAMVSTLCPYAEAVRIVRTSKGRGFYLHVQQFAPSRDTSGNTTNLTQGLSVRTTVEVSKREALKFLRNAYGSSKVRDQAYVRISYCSNCLFIG